MKPYNKLLIALALGLVLGIALHGQAQAVWLQWVNQHILQTVGQIFLRMIFMVVVPLLVSALILGVFELGQARGLGTVALRTVGYTLLASTLSVLIGISLVRVVQPGAGFDRTRVNTEASATMVQSIEQSAKNTKGFAQILVDLIPKNPIDSAARAFDGEIVALMIFALLFGIALSFVDPERTKTLIGVFDGVYQTSLKVVEIAMRLAPVAVFSIVFGTAFKFGASILGTLLLYVAVVVAGLCIQQFVVYAVLLKVIGRRAPFEFFRKCREVYLYAFSTASSNATLPTALQVAERELKLPPQISRFVLTVGSTANQNGTALFEGITVLFLAQVYQVDLSFGQQIQVVLMSILAGIGTAGVPGGSLPLIALLLQSVGIPAEGIGIILGVDRFLDMCRTTLNVSGDLVIAALVSGKPRPIAPVPATAQVG